MKETSGRAAAAWLDSPSTIKECSNMRRYQQYVFMYPSGIFREWGMSWSPTLGLVTQSCSKDCVTSPDSICKGGWSPTKRNISSINRFNRIFLKFNILCREDKQETYLLSHSWIMYSLRLIMIMMMMNADTEHFIFFSGFGSYTVTYTVKRGVKDSACWFFF